MLRYFPVMYLESNIFLKKKKQIKKNSTKFSADKKNSIEVFRILSKQMECKENNGKFSCFIDVIENIFKNPSRFDSFFKVQKIQKKAIKLF